MEVNVPHYLISSDWHFGDSNIIEHERYTEFDNIEQHDTKIVELVSKWLCKLKADDTFYFLGDWGHLKGELNDKLMNAFDKAPCRKVAIKGNHDKEQQIDEMRQFFDEIYDYPLFIADRVVLSHFPCAVWDDEINIHGHLHNSTLNSNNHICASIHVCNYKPISEKHTQSAFGKISKRNRRFLWEPWADKYKFTGKKKECIYDKNGVIDLSASRILQRLIDLGKVE